MCKYLLLTSFIGLTILSESEKWWVDGTFKTAPKFYYQHYIIHGKYKNKWPLPGMFSFMSGKSYELISTSEKQSYDMKSGSSYYIVEYIIKKGVTLKQHCISVIATKESTNNLYTLTVMCPESEWKSTQHKIQEIANSFVIT
jgi:hypothetical protein